MSKKKPAWPVSLWILINDLISFSSVGPAQSLALQLFLAKLADRLKSTLSLLRQY